MSCNRPEKPSSLELCIYSVTSESVISPISSQCGILDNADANDHQRLKDEAKDFADLNGLVFPLPVPSNESAAEKLERGRLETALRDIFVDWFKLNAQVLLDNIRSCQAKVTPASFRPQNPYERVGTMRGIEVRARAVGMTPFMAEVDVFTMRRSIDYQTGPLTRERFYQTRGVVLEMACRTAVKYHVGYLKNSDLKVLRELADHLECGPLGYM